VDALVPFPSPNRSAKEPRRRPGRSAQQRPGYLPSPPTPLVGRVHEIHSVESQLQGDGALGIQLLTVVGPPGAGKTRLAIAAAQRLATSYEHGVYFVDLGAVRETEAAAAAIAHRIGATYRSGRPIALDETLKRWFKTRRVLLVLDNFEGVLQAADLVEDLLTECPDRECWRPAARRFGPGASTGSRSRPLQRRLRTRLSRLPCFGSNRCSCL